MTQYKYILTGEIFSEEDLRHLIGEGFDANPLELSLLYGSKESYVDRMLSMRSYGFLPLQEGEMTGSFFVGMYRDDSDDFDVFYHTDDEEEAFLICEEYNEIVEQEFATEFADLDEPPFGVLSLLKW